MYEGKQVLQFNQFPRRILIITTEYPPDIGGGGMFAYYLCNALPELGVETHVLIGQRRKVRPVQRTQNNLFLHPVRIKYSTGICISTSLLDNALKICREINPDVIHGNHFDGTIIGSCLKHSFAKPLVSTLHKTPLLYFPKDIAQRRAYYSFLRWVTKLDVNKFIAGSQAFQTELAELGVNGDKISLIYHGIPVSQIDASANLGIVPSNLRGKTVIICPCRLDRRKRLELFVGACAIVKKTLPRKSYVFLVTGQDSTRDEKEYRNELETIAERAGIGKELVFKTFDVIQMPSIYRCARAVVLPSDREGLGLVLLESMAASAPVVASNSLGVREVVSDERNGLLFNIGEENDLASQLIRILSEKGLAERIVKEGRLTVKEFDVNDMAKKYLDLYDKIIH